ncbi:hypothetical protein P171DRAFT_230795 [Karstenula rhodostoma CBS 690.94]|uniref:Uncharacterized protein n=1 Tax=Karstenula rhodostoma CBS 690.94 TaxID=1392251 RepID=A0A9P4UER2_9PLEO|nr:hypothetical protein P171DRAFT_230795 [Karstenula rhodostoma CBS 690.94]
MAIGHEGGGSVVQMFRFTLRRQQSNTLDEARPKYGKSLITPQDKAWWSEVGMGNQSCPVEMDWCPDVAWLCTAVTRGSRVILSESMALPEAASRRNSVAVPPWRLYAHVVTEIKVSTTTPYSACAVAAPQPGRDRFRPPGKFDCTSNSGDCV